MLERVSEVCFGNSAWESDQIAILFHSIHFLFVLLDQSDVSGDSEVWEECNRNPAHFMLTLTSKEAMNFR